jgi:hypothetical protein
MYVEYFNVYLNSRRWFMLCSVYISSLVLGADVSRIEAGSHTSTAALRVAGGYEKRILKYETVKYGHE